MHEECTSRESEDRFTCKPVGNRGVEERSGSGGGKLGRTWKKCGTFKIGLVFEKLRREFFSGEKRFPGILRFRVFRLVLEGTGMWERQEMRNGNKGRVHLVRFTGYTLRGNFH